MESIYDELERSVDMLRECVRIREGQLTLPCEFCNVVNDIICFLCSVHRLVYGTLLCILFFCVLSVRFNNK